MIYIFVLLIFVALFVILLIPTLIFSAIRTIFSIIGFLFGGKKRTTRSGFEKRYDFRENNSRGSAADDVQYSRKKMFDKDEGEYVDFEEIND